jgi:hypothetical protein
MCTLSSEIGLKHYFRDVMETASCESKGRRHLDRRELHAKGGDSFDINEEGVPCLRKYGVPKTGWMPVPKISKNWKYLNADDTVIPSNLFQIYPSCVILKTLVGSLAKKDIGGTTRRRQKSGMYVNSNHKVTLPQHRCRSIHLFDSKAGNSFQRLKTLADVNYGVHRADCVDMLEIGETAAVCQLMRQHGLNTDAGQYHIAEDNSATEAFYGHIDKRVFDVPSVFVPVDGYFYLLLVLPRSMAGNKVDDSEPLLLEIRRKESAERKQTVSFWENFNNTITGDDSLVTAAHRCCPGIAISFRSDLVHHATIVPRQESIRKLLILHKMVAEH